MNKVDQFANILVSVFHRLALFAIGAGTVWSAGWTFLQFMDQPVASINDLLLLFIYVELGAMVGIYFKTNHMPVRFLLYIVMTALTRHMLLATNHEVIDLSEIMIVAIATLITSLSILIVKYTSYKFSGERKDDIV